MDGLKINSIKNPSRLNSSGGISLDSTFASKLALAFCNLGIVEILNAIK